MKPLHAGLLVLGAAIAGGLAVRMSQPPPGAMSVAAPVAPPRSVPLAEPEPVAVAAPPVSAAPEQAMTVTPEQAGTSAPPPLYEVPPAPKRKPFYEAPKHSVKQSPVTVARVAPMAINPAPYQLPSISAKPPAPVAAPIPTAEPTPEPVAEMVKPQPAPEPRQVTLHQGSQISVRLDQSLSPEHIANGDTFQASLSEPLVADGLVIAEKGARVTGRVANAQKAGRLSSTPVIELALSSVQTADGQRVAISTEPWTKEGDSSRNSAAAKIGGGAALGAVIGAIAGGGVGAAIGAGAGGVLGAGASAVARGKPLNIPSETVLRFRLAAQVTITERPL